MPKEYFKSIELLEGVYLPDKKVLLARNWDQYFELKFYFDEGEFYEIHKEIFQSIQEKNKKKTPLNQTESSVSKQASWLVKLASWVDRHFHPLSKYYTQANPETLPLNDRSFKPKDSHEILEFIRGECITHFQIGYARLKPEEQEKIISLFQKIVGIEKHFCFEAFFSDHESFFDTKNDFQLNKKIYLGLRDDSGTELDTLETQLSKLPQKYKYYTKIEFAFPGIKHTNQHKKYEQIFILERGRYTYHQAPLIALFY